MKLISHVFLQRILNAENVMSAARHWLLRSGRAVHSCGRVLVLPVPPESGAARDSLRAAGTLKRRRCRKWSRAEAQVRKMEQLQPCAPSGDLICTLLK